MQGFTTHSALETLRLRLRVTNIAIHCKTLHNPTLVVCYFYIINERIQIHYITHNACKINGGQLWQVNFKNLVDFIKFILVYFIFFISDSEF